MLDNKAIFKERNCRITLPKTFWEMMLRNCNSYALSICSSKVLNWLGRLLKTALLTPDPLWKAIDPCTHFRDRMKAKMVVELKTFMLGRKMVVVKNRLMSKVSKNRAKIGWSSSTFSKINDEIIKCSHKVREAHLAHSRLFWHIYF